MIVTVATQSLSDRYGGVVYPEQFGAKADGTTDDSAAIQTAINTGKTVQIQPGKTYALANSLTYPAIPGQNFQGVNSRTSVLLQTVANKDVFVLQNVTDPIQGGGCYSPGFFFFRIQGPGVATSTGSGFNGLGSGVVGDNIRSRDVAITAMNFGWNINNFGNCSIENPWIQGCNYGFVAGNADGNGMQLTGCQISENYKYNIRIQSGLGWIVDLADSNLGVQSQSGANNCIGISVENGARAQIRGSNCEYQGNTGLRAIQVLGGSAVVLLNASYICDGGGNSAGVQPIYVDGFSFLRAAAINAGGFTVSAVKADNGADVQGDGFSIDFGDPTASYTVAVGSNDARWIWDNGIPSAVAASVGQKLNVLYRHNTAGRMERLMGVSVSDGSGGYTYLWSDITNDVMLNTPTTFNSTVVVASTGTLTAINATLGKSVGSGGNGRVAFGNTSPNSQALELLDASSQVGFSPAGTLNTQVATPIYAPNVNSSNTGAGNWFSNAGIISKGS